MRRSLLEKILILAIGLFFFFPGFSQQEENWKSVLEQRMDTDAEISYLHLVGYFDELIFTEIWFAYDTADWTGILSFPDSDMRFDLEGFQQGDDLFFNEYDPEGMPTGYWTFKKDLNLYLGKWQNLEGNMDFELTMFDEFWNPDYKKDYHKKINSYRGEIWGVPLMLDISRKHMEPIQMEWFDLDERKRSLADWNCEDPFCREFLIQPFEVLNERSTLRFKVEDKMDFLEVTLPVYDSIETKELFELENEHITQILASLDLDHKLVLEYPELKLENPENSFEAFYRDILDSINYELGELLSAEEDPSSRWEHFANAWFEVYFWDTDYLSGKWIIQRNWTDEQWSIPVNYDISEDEFFQIESQFKPGFDLDFFLLHYVQSEIKKLPQYMDPLSRNKLQQADFRYITICRAGLVLSTDFDTITGTFQLMIPFEDLDPYIKKRSKLKKLMLSFYDD